MKVEIEIGGQFVENPEEYLPGVIGGATLFEDLAPKTIAALRKIMPVTSRTIHTFRLGQTWRTEDNFRLTESGKPEENLFAEAAPIPPGTLIYFKPGEKYKLMMVYGMAHSYPTTRLSVIGQVDENLTALINQCRKILYQGPFNFTIREKK
jgi:hypothetical protein